MKHLLTVSLPFAILFPVWLMAGSSSESPQKIEMVLQTQVTAWNEGDLDRFMETYWNSPDLTFFSGGTTLSGWRATLERYRRTYQKEGQDMGQLHFSDLKVVYLSDESGLVRGRFHLQRKGLDELTGIFTLVLKDSPDGWKIIHDHTSTGE